MEKVIKLQHTEKGSYWLEIIQDETSINPRVDFDNLGTMVCFHRRYDLGDLEERKRYNDPDDFRETITEDENIMLPLYLYDHSGITMNTTGFSCRFDSGQVGVIYVSKEKVMKEYGWHKLTRKRIAKIQNILRGEVKMYDQYLTGDVYGYKLWFIGIAMEALVSIDYDPKEDNIKDFGEEIDSCWGFFGGDHTENGMKDNYESALQSHMNNKVENSMVE